MQELCSFFLSTKKKIFFRNYCNGTMSLRNFGGAEKAGHKVMEKRQVTKKLPLYNEMIQS